MLLKIPQKIRGKSIREKCFSKSTELFDKSLDFQLDVIIASNLAFECRSCEKRCNNFHGFMRHTKKFHYHCSLVFLFPHYFVNLSKRGDGYLCLLTVILI